MNFLVDELGQTKAAIAALKERETQIRDAIIATGDTSLSGVLYDASVSYDVSRDYLDMAKVKAILTPKQLKRCTSTTQPVSIVRVTARKAQAA